MKVILNSDIDKLGRRGDIVEVAAGYARNFLLPRNLALVATKGGIRQAEGMQRAREDQERKERESFEALAGRISGLSLRISSRAGEEGQLFGSVTTADIAEVLEKALGEEVDRRKIHTADAIRSVGTHEFTVALHRDVNAVGTIEVVAEQ